ncbi:LPS export ABC transporter periplasmic protein LptC [Phormidesmis priestleyi ULC007]|uniref:LPS export ABC transporter periplasmic protein LptC n=1 Tax=Phormidesmis priestleyi ULC007 TaxID=1920490 RepID=A0A2T1D8D7_9CYAN|nr:LPS export ABC transporter periplasmic protein LptC [Phormidesmis priestleyi]PSB16704.1 LPS export ABC transporter periplasmic protein LptC [Phormidesmis priestleyi ULC007]PZO47595.1 MAG: LPS export ABC transporter periplasmic protein LptC [Phormidesmis priestleyi]
MLTAIKKTNLQRTIALNLLLITLLTSVGGCLNRNRTADKLREDTKEIQRFDSNATFNDVTLEQADDRGKLWWKVKAKQASYSKDQKNAVIEDPKGELYQDGKPVFQISAQKGEVKGDGKSILLKGKIIATDIRDGTLLKGDELEWRPTEDMLLVRNNVTGTHKQMQFSAQEGRVLTRARTMELFRQIVASSKKPELQMRTEHLTWNVKGETVIADRPIQIDQYKNKVLTDRGSADKANVDLKAKTVNLQQNAQLDSKEKGVQVSSNNLLWNLDAQTINSSQPITIINPPQQVTLNANQGQMDLQKNTVDLVGNVRGIGQKNQSKLDADRVLWFITTQQFEATGNVNYRQENPPFSLAGPRASGKLDDQQVAVNGGRVELQITPQPKQ